MKFLFPCILLFLSLVGLSATEADMLKINGIKNEMLCGVQATYLGTNLLRPGSQSYEEILEYFGRAVVDKGSTLREIKQFLDEKTPFQSRLVFCDEAELHGMGKDVVGLVLLEAHPISHMVVKHHSKEGLQTLDPANGLTHITQANFSPQKQATLILSSNPTTTEKKFFHFYLGIGLLIPLPFLFFRKTRKKHEKNIP